MQKSIYKKNPKVAEEIEKIIRDKAGLISKKIEGNPSPKEKISDKEECLYNGKNNIF